MSVFAWALLYPRLRSSQKTEPLLRVVDYNPSMKSLHLLLVLSSALAACASTPAPAPQAPEPVTAPAPAPAVLTIVGSWTDEGGDPYRFLEDGSFEAPRAFEGAQKSAIACAEAGLNVEPCSTPSFKWLGHPTDDARYLIAMSMPLMNQDEETQEVQCLCPPEPGLPFSAMLTENRLVLNALQPNGAPVVGGEFVLTRQPENAAP